MNLDVPNQEIILHSLPALLPPPPLSIKHNSPKGFPSFLTSPLSLSICSLSFQKKMIIGGCGALGAQGDFFLETDRLSEKRPERSAHEVLVPYSNF